MPPKLQNRTFHIRRNSPHRLGTQEDHNREGVPPPIVSVAVGTAGYKRSWRWAQRMGEAGVLDRVQSLLMYDCNQGTIDTIDAETQAMRRRDRFASLPVIVPGYLPKVDGFLRDPNAYKDYYGLIHRDMERMVDTVTRRAEEVGSPPQIILEWFGFGGHAKLGGVLHEMLMERFPDALFFPIMLMPREHVLEENMRRETWGAYEETMGLARPRTLSNANGQPHELRGYPALITDNRLSRDYQRLDNKLAIGLASMEAGMRDRIDSGSLAETIASFGGYSNGWFGMRVMSRRLDVNNVPQLAPRWLPSRLRRSELVVVNDDAKQLSWATKKAMWDILDPNKQDMNLANHDFIHGESVMRMVITLPVEAEGLADIETDVRDQLDREDFELAYPNLTWSFASANFEEGAGERHMHVSLLYPLQTENIYSITDIMHDSYTPAHLADGLLQTGFGTRHYMGSNGSSTESGTQYGYVSRGEQVKLERERAGRAAVSPETRQYGNGNANGHENGAGGFPS